MGNYDVWLVKLEGECLATYSEKKITLGIGESVLINGENITEQGIYYDTIQNAAQCDSIIKYTVTMSVINNILNSKTNQLIQLYPNPTSSYVSLSFSNTQTKVSIRVLNILGEELKAEYYPYVQQIKLELPEQTGIYFIEITNNVGLNNVFKVLKR